MSRIALFLMGLFIVACDPVYMAKIYPNNVDGIYAQGLAALKSGDYGTAREDFEKVMEVAGGESNLYSTISALRLADILFFQEHYVEAEHAYKRFIDTVGDNPKAPGIDYAYFRMILCQWEQKGETFFLIPPDDRRNQTQIIKAYNTAKKFLARFPNSPYFEQVEKVYRTLSKIRTSYNLEVARFYLARKKPLAAASRLSYLMDEVPMAQSHPEVLKMYVMALAEAGERRKAKEECLKHEQLSELRKVCKRLE